jgi:predicted DNA-binding transcriptional regulator AlpA
MTPDQEDTDHQPGHGPARDADRLLTPGQVAAIFGGRTTGSTVARRYKKWELPAVKVGRELRFWESQVYEWLKNHPA